jgi:hypothetical protein
VLGHEEKVHSSAESFKAFVTCQRCHFLQAHSSIHKIFAEGMAQAVAGKIIKVASVLFYKIRTYAVGGRESQGAAK